MVWAERDVKMDIDEGVAVCSLAIQALLRKLDLKTWHVQKLKDVSNIKIYFCRHEPATAMQCVYYYIISVE